MSAAALVTGATGGLGKAVVHRLLDDGWRVVAVWHRERALGSLEQHERLAPVRADLFREDDARRAVAAAGADLGAVVNLVGGYAGGARIHETPIDRFEAQLELNLRATYLVCQAAIPPMVARGGGAIVSVSSRAAVQPFPGAAGYVVGKAGVLALTEALAVEYRRDRIRANAVLPSVIDSPANRAAMPGADYSTWVRPEEIAEVIAFLCGEGAAVTSGGRIPVYGQA